MKINLIIVFTMLLLFSCNENGNKLKQTSTPQSRKKINYQKHSANSKVYSFENDEKQQFLEINYLDKNIIEFNLTLSLNNGSCKVIETGNAIAQNDKKEYILNEKDMSKAVAKLFLYEKGKLSIKILIEEVSNSQAIALLDGYYTSCYPASTDLLTLVK